MKIRISDIFCFLETLHVINTNWRGSIFVYEMNYKMLKYRLTMYISWIIYKVCAVQIWPSKSREKFIIIIILWWIGTLINTIRKVVHKNLVLRRVAESTTMINKLTSRILFRKKPYLGQNLISKGGLHPPKTIRVLPDDSGNWNLVCSLIWP